MTRAARVEVRTEEYEFAHGKAPRGSGQWIFDMGSGATHHAFSYYGRFTEARKAAVKDAKVHGYTRVEVGP